MSFTRSTFFKWAAAGVVAAGALFAATSASARSDVSWSIGVGVPGVAVGVGSSGEEASEETERKAGVMHCEGSWAESSCCWLL